MQANVSVTDLCHLYKHYVVRNDTERKKKIAQLLDGLTDGLQALPRQDIQKSPGINPNALGYDPNWQQSKAANLLSNKAK